MAEVTSSESVHRKRTITLLAVLHIDSYCRIVSYPTIQVSVVLKAREENKVGLLKLSIGCGPVSQSTSIHRFTVLKTHKIIDMTMLLEFGPGKVEQLFPRRQRRFYDFR
jgi:hypothetical protein